MDVPNLNGEWHYMGQEDQPCAIFQQGRVLMVISETHQIGVGSFGSQQHFTIPGWKTDATINDGGNRITWQNQKFWVRSPNKQPYLKQ